MTSTDTVIIGAGPYGLSLATHLEAAGVPHQILGQPMHAWRNFMPPGMLMRSEAFACNIHAPHRGYSVKEYCAQKRISYRAIGMKLPLGTFVDYGLWFQSQLVSNVRAVDVVNMHRTDGRFQLEMSDGTALSARSVVIALGLKGFEQTPPSLQGLPESYASHSCKYGSIAWARQKDIVIVGGGQSALGLAALLHEVGARARVLVRDAAVFWNSTPVPAQGISRLLRPDAGLGPGLRSYVLSEFPQAFYTLGRQTRKTLLETINGPSGAWWLHDRVVGHIDVSFRAEVRDVAVESGKVILRVTSGNKESYIAGDHVIAATGFKTDMRRHTFISQEVMDSMSMLDGIPILTRNFETSVHGLYVIGPASAHSFGPVMRFVLGTKHAAPRVAWHIRASSRRTSV
jgi:cation diffusion facilitator CzcD-associated flavoprotein CzcO